MGKLLGYLAGFWSIDRLEQIAAERAGLGRTGKTYLVGSRQPGAYQYS